MPSNQRRHLSRHCTGIKQAILTAFLVGRLRQVTRQLDRLLTTPSHESGALYWRHVHRVYGTANCLHRTTQASMFVNDNKGTVSEIDVEIVHVS